MKSVVVAFNYVDFQDYHKKRRQNVAMELLCRSPKNIFPVGFTFLGDVCHREWDRIVSYNILKRNSAHTIENNRELPYIREILENCCDHFPCPKYPDVIGFINSDILLGNSFYDVIQSDADAFVLSRSDIVDVTADEFLDGKFKVIFGGDKHPGADGFFFKRSWWLENQKRFPKDLILGETEWDTCYRSIIRKLDPNHIESRCLYHMYHDAKWSLTSSGAKNNLEIWAKIKEKYGV